LQTPDLLFLEITGKCQLSCVHCYADSGPRGTHGTMTSGDWERVIQDAADIGVPMVQFTGGEPTMHHDLPRLVRFALSRRLEVEIYTNLVHTTAQLWELFSLPGVRIGTSYYSDRPRQHQAVTGMAGSHDRTTRAIGTAVELGIPIRVGLIGIHNGQRVEEARRMLAGLGVRDIRVDRVREVGRASAQRRSEIGWLCGACAENLLTVLPNGIVSLCPLSRWLAVGNVRHERLVSVLASPALRQHRDAIREASRDRSGSRGFQLVGQPHCAPP
jgi:MoaA/NifB/PqqE/SkfB family radical SAM enzyme